jgi:hypothetical protein
MFRSMLLGNALSMEPQKNMTTDRLTQLGEERAQGIDEVRGVKDGVKSVKELVTGKRWTDSRSCRSAEERLVLGGPHTIVKLATRTAELHLDQSGGSL